MQSISDLLNIKCETVLVSNINKSEKAIQLLEHENVLRRIAYKNAQLTLGPAFFDNSDMISDYYIVIVYDRRTQTPLLSSRHYYHKATIQKKLDGQNAIKMRSESNLSKVELANYEQGKIFLADRLSANSQHATFIKNRNLIFLKYYLELFRNNIGNNYFLMAKSEKYEKLLTKYLRLGLLIVGKTRHRDLDHWILFGDFRTSIDLFKRNNLLWMLLLIISIFKRKKI